MNKSVKTPQATPGAQQKSLLRGPAARRVKLLADKQRADAGEDGVGMSFREGEASNFPHPHDTSGINSREHASFLGRESPALDSKGDAYLTKDA